MGGLGYEHFRDGREDDKDYGRSAMMGAALAGVPALGIRLADPDTRAHISALWNRSTPSIEELNNSAQELQGQQNLERIKMQKKLTS